LVEKFPTVLEKLRQVLRVGIFLTHTVDEKRASSDSSRCPIAESNEIDIFYVQGCSPKKKCMGEA